MSSFTRATGRRDLQIDGCPRHGWSAGLLFGSLGMLAFSGTLPATRAAAPFFGATVLTCSRIEIAAALGVVALCVMNGRKWPRRNELTGILLSGIGLAIGYPFFVALALTDVPSSHGAVVVGLTPAATAIVSVLRAGERPSELFWLACGMGVTAVAAFAIYEGGGAIRLADAWLLVAMLSAGLAYVEGGKVSRVFGATATLCWAMIMLAPLAAIPLIIEAPYVAWPAIPWSAWTGFAYTGVVSMFLGSLAWYRGLAEGGIARIGQLNLATPFVALIWSAALLGERISWLAVSTAVIVLASIVITIKSRVNLADRG